MATISTPAWVKDAVFYQIFPDRFARSERVPKPSNLEPWDAPPTPYGFKGGDLLGVVEHLDYLVDLGVNALYFNPIFQSTANHRYHTHDYSRVDPILGGDDAFRALVEAAHARDVRVVLDGVFNHASRGFYPFNHTLENGVASPYIDWFYFDRERLARGEALNAYPLEVTPPARLGYRAWWDLPALPKFNVETPAVRRFLLDVARYWVEQGIDGWRLDVPQEIDDPSFWRAFRHTVKDANPDAYLVGEIWGEAEAWLAGDRFDAVMNYPLTRACLGFFGGSDLDTAHNPGGYPLFPMDAVEFADTIDDLLARYDWAITTAQLNLLDSHDTPRFLTWVRGDRDALKLALLFLMTFPGAPCIYYGDEIGLAGGPDPDCRRAFPWDEARWDDELLAWVRRATALRHAHPALRRGAYVRLHADDARALYAFARRGAGETVAVVLNNGAGAAPLDVPARSLWAEETPLRDVWGGGTARVADGRLVGADLTPRSAAVLVEAGP
jgi:neopullulanase